MIDTPSRINWYIENCVRLYLVNLAHIVLSVEVTVSNEVKEYIAFIAAQSAAHFSKPTAIF